MSSIKNRGLWSWGHVIYDYEKYFSNMEKLSLNTMVIWNDIRPLNAEEVLEAAHQHGIRLLWGFAWGWMDQCAKNVRDIGNETLRKTKEKILLEFFRDYEAISPDGIYFQSFTEMQSDTIGGRVIADVVTDFVNDVAGELLERHPEMEIQFGLHATSVKGHLESIAKVDKRIRIVWEDCGAFPFHYEPSEVDQFEETYDLIKKLLHLRGEKEKAGFVIKGMTTLDWSMFSYHTKPYQIGGKDEAFLKKRMKEKEALWDSRTADWKKNGEYVRKIMELISRENPDSFVEGLVEDGVFEQEIKYPVAFFAETALNP